MTHPNRANPVLRDLAVVDARAEASERLHDRSPRWPIIAAAIALVCCVVMGYGIPALTATVWGLIAQLGAGVLGGALLVGGLFALGLCAFRRWTSAAASSAPDGDSRAVDGA